MEVLKMRKAVLVFAAMALLVTTILPLFAADAQYIGATKCKMCHKSEKKGNQFGKWEAGPHAKAYATLATDEAKAVAKKAGIEKLADLAGKKIATPFQSTSHYALKVALKLANVEESRMEIINMDPEQMLAAWEKGGIQAGYVWNPNLTRMVETGGKILLSSKELALRGFPTADLFVARKDFAEKYPRVVSGVVNDLSRAAELCRADPAKASTAVAKGPGISPEKALKEMEGMIFLTTAEQKVGLYIGKLQWEFGLYTLLKDAADFLEKEGAIEKSPPWPAFRRAINPGFIEELYRKLKRPKY